MFYTDIPILPITIKPVEQTDIAAIAAFCAQRHQTEPFRADRIDTYSEANIPRQAIISRPGRLKSDRGILHE